MTPSTPSPRAAVIVPVFNAEPWIRATLESVLAQTLRPQDYEIVVVDSGSTDASIARAREVLAQSDARYRVLATDQGGPSQARNLGWRATDADWIQFLDADDLLSPDKMRAQLEVAASTEPDVAVVYSSWQKLELDRGRWLPHGDVVAPQVGHRPVIDLIRAEGFVPFAAGLVRRSWLERTGGFSEDRFLIEDVELMLRIAMADGRFQQISLPEPALLYRQHDASLSRSDPTAFVRGCLDNARAVERFMREHDRLDDDARRAITQVYFQATRHHAGRDWEEFGRIWAEIERLVPGAIPPGPAHLALLSRLVGYPRAERVAVIYRTLRALGSRGLAS